MPSPTATAALLAAVEPIAAYVARTPAGNAHADKCALLVDAVADYVDEAAAADFEPPAPDWEAIASQLAGLLPPTAPTALMSRCRAFLDSPAMQARAALPLAQRMALAEITSHHLGTPDTL